MDEIFTFLNEKKITPAIGKVFNFKDIRKALIAQDEGRINGKIVVTL